MSKVKDDFLVFPSENMKELYAELKMYPNIVKAQPVTQQNKYESNN